MLKVGKGAPDDRVERALYQRAVAVTIGIAQRGLMIGPGFFGVGFIQGPELQPYRVVRRMVLTVLEE